MSAPLSPQGPFGDAATHEVPREESVAQRILTAHAAEAANRLKEASVITHPGERGRAREEILRSYLLEIVPDGFRVGTGFVIDSAGGQSRQQDLIIVRKDYHPRFQIGGIHFFPVESVAAVIEVKSTLTKATLRDAVDNSMSVKRLDRSGGGLNYLVHGGIGGQRGEPVRVDYDDHLILAMVVSAKAELSVEAGYDTVMQTQHAEPRQHWVNAVGVASNWYLAYDVPAEHPRTYPTIATGIRAHEASQQPNPDPLIDIAFDLWSWLRVAPLIDARPDNYITPSTIGRVSAIY